LLLRNEPANDQWFLDRVATCILEREGDASWFRFEGDFMQRAALAQQERRELNNGVVRCE